MPDRIEDSEPDMDIVVLNDGETWSSVEGCYVRYDGKVYSLASLLYGSYLPVEEPLRIYIDECTHEAVVENPNVSVIEKEEN